MANGEEGTVRKIRSWALKLQEHDFTIQYRPGKKNANAD